MANRTNPLPPDAADVALATQAHVTLRALGQRAAGLDVPTPSDREVVSARATQADFFESLKDAERRDLSWTYRLESMDTATAPISDLQALVATAPTGLTAAWLQAIVDLRLEGASLH